MTVISFSGESETLAKKLHFEAAFISKDFYSYFQTVARWRCSRSRILSTLRALELLKIWFSGLFVN